MEVKEAGRTVTGLGVAAPPSMVMMSKSEPSRELEFQNGFRLSSSEE
jgi:hypothetical protein